MIYPGMMESVYLKILQINRLLVLLDLKLVTVIRINRFLLEQKNLKTVQLINDMTDLLTINYDSYETKKNSHTDFDCSVV